MSATRRFPLALDWREALLATVTLAWLALIAVFAGSGAHGAGQPTACTIVSVGKTEPASCRAQRLGFARPASVAGGAILLTDGRKLRIVPGLIASSIDSSIVMGSGSSRAAEISGWAGSPTLRRPAGAVLVFSGARFVGAIGPTVKRPDVARGFHVPALQGSGFTFEVPLTLLAGTNGKTSVQLFAVVGGAASPMSFNCAKPPRQFGC